MSSATFKLNKPNKKAHLPEEWLSKRFSGSVRMFNA